MKKTISKLLILLILITKSSFSWYKVVDNKVFYSDLYEINEATLKHFRI